ncbi:hypothetical protein SAY87_026238 [Trapa incisa]|uniref:Uncharacterized protein n=1 Tax=Trapa incisa TaxID=236973 RepID=A0AAN7JCW6_9MYRT|nr:hypothetical protein SAY87_026238 [Trapa incisa]
MASPAVRVSFHVALAVLVVLVLFYVGRPLCWKITATVHDIRHNKQTLKHGLSQIVYEAKSVGWFHDQSDPCVADDRKVHRDGAAAARRLLHTVNPL